MDDIVDDDKRAIDVIGRLRSFLKKGALIPGRWYSRRSLRWATSSPVLHTTEPGPPGGGPELHRHASRTRGGPTRSRSSERTSRRRARLGHPVCLDGCRDSITEVGDVPVDPAWAVALWRDVLPAPPIHARVLI